MPEETESSLEIQKHITSHRAWDEAVIYSKFISSNKYLKIAVLSSTATVIVTIKGKSLKLYTEIETLLYLEPAGIQMLPLHCGPLSKTG